MVDRVTELLGIGAQVHQEEVKQTNEIGMFTQVLDAIDMVYAEAFY